MISDSLFSSYLAMKFWILHFVYSFLIVYAIKFGHFLLSGSFTGLPSSLDGCQSIFSLAGNDIMSDGIATVQHRANIGRPKEK